MQRFHYGVIAAALLAATSVAVAQQEKTQQNSADEALTRSAPEAKDPPQAPPQARAKRSFAARHATKRRCARGRQAGGAGRAARHARRAGENLRQERPDRQDADHGLSARAHRRAEARHLSTPDPRRGAGSDRRRGAVSNITAKPSEQVPATLALQELPPEMAASMPSVADYKFLRLRTTDSGGESAGIDRGGRDHQINARYQLSWRGSEADTTLREVESASLSTTTLSF